jgi:hypothetical protein
MHNQPVLESSSAATTTAETSRMFRQKPPWVILSFFFRVIYTLSDADYAPRLTDMKKKVLST